MQWDIPCIGEAEGCESRGWITLRKSRRLGRGASGSHNEPRIHRIESIQTSFLPNLWTEELSVPFWLQFGSIFMSLCGDKDFFLRVHVTRPHVTFTAWCARSYEYIGYTAGVGCCGDGVPRVGRGREVRCREVQCKTTHRDNKNTTFLSLWWRLFILQLFDLVKVGGMLSTLYISTLILISLTTTRAQITAGPSTLLLCPLIRILLLILLLTWFHSLLSFILGHKPFLSSVMLASFLHLDRMDRRNILGPKCIGLKWQPCSDVSL